jgi:hypothetical protein
MCQENHGKNAPLGLWNRHDRGGHGRGDCDTIIA